jgi:hypothetical protein
MMGNREEARVHLGKALELGVRSSLTENLNKILKNSIQKN